INSMPGNTFGTLFKITSFGESHGPAIGVVIDGCPAGLEIDTEFIQKQLDRRKPGQSSITTPRKEEDEVHIMSGVFEGKSTGAPIGLIIYNKDHKPEDYERFKNVYRPSHADFTYDQKYGFRDYRGGGRSSARETATRVAAGAVAQLLLRNTALKIYAFVSQAGNIKLDRPYSGLNLEAVDANIVRCPDAETAGRMIKLIEETREAGDSIGGVISCVIKNCPIGLGEPVFDKLHADLGKAMLSINAVKGFEIGSGFRGSGMKGSEHNDEFLETDGKISTKTNHS